MGGLTLSRQRSGHGRASRLTNAFLHRKPMKGLRVKQPKPHEPDACRCTGCEQAYRGSGCALERLAQRVALDLHDGVAQSLAVILMNAEHSACDACPVSIGQNADCPTESVAAALSQIRMLIEDLHPAEHPQSCLAARLSAALESFTAETGVTVSLDMSARDLVSLRRNAEITAFRVIQECLNNIRRHAQASQVEISIDARGTDFSARITDNGSGMDEPGAHLLRECNDGMGIAGMKERIELLSGTLSLTSHRERGTAVEFTIPFARECSSE